MPVLQDFLELFRLDPFLAYTLIASIFLATVSLSAGWFRLDFLPIVRPKGLFHISLAVFLAFIIVFLYKQFVPPEAPFWLVSLVGLSRLPLYVVVLAYGPSAGFLSAALFAAFAGSTGIPNYAVSILALELVVLGWFAIAPSPFVHRWAGPLNAGLAYLLTWIAGGSALLQWQTGNAALLSTHWVFQKPFLLGAGISMLCLFCFAPAWYRRIFTTSRIAPQVPLKTAPAPTQEPHDLIIVEALEPKADRHQHQLDEVTISPAGLADSPTRNPNLSDTTFKDLRKGRKRNRKLDKAKLEET